MYSRKESILELFHNQITKVQGIYSIRTSYDSYGIHIIANNLGIPCTVLDFRPEQIIREVKRATIHRHQLHCAEFPEGQMDGGADQRAIAANENHRRRILRWYPRSAKSAGRGLCLRRRGNQFHARIARPAPGIRI